MPLKKKRANDPNDEPEEMDLQLNEDSDASSDDDDDDGLDGTYDGNEEIQVDFEGRSPIDTDFHGIRQLLHQLLLKAPVNLSELADIVIGQNYIGSVVTQCVEEEDDDEDVDYAMEEANTVFGITTAINLTHKADIGCLQALREHLLTRAERNADEESLKAIRALLSGEDGNSIAFLLNERFVNIPPQISVPLLESLSKEVEKAAAQGMPFKFDYYVMLVKLYRTHVSAKKGKKNKKSSSAMADDDFYTNAEEEVFVDQALYSFEYTVKGEAHDSSEADGLPATDDDSGLVPYRKLVIFEASKLTKLIDSIKSLIEV